MRKLQGSPTVSIVIPAHNRKDILIRTLQAYASQSAKQHIFEILVIDDGSTDGTSESVQSYAAGSPIPIRYFYQHNHGATKARNLGIAQAQGNLILFGHDDVIPGEGYLSQHVSWHQKYPDPHVAILGYVDWPPKCTQRHLCDGWAKPGRSLAMPTWSLDEMRTSATFTPAM